MGFERKCRTDRPERLAKLSTERRVTRRTTSIAKDRAGQLPAKLTGPLWVGETLQQRLRHDGEHAG